MSSLYQKTGKRVVFDTSQPFSGCAIAVGAVFAGIGAVGVMRSTPLLIEQVRGEPMVLAPTGMSFLFMALGLLAFMAGLRGKRRVKRIELDPERGQLDIVDAGYRGKDVKTPVPLGEFRRFDLGQHTSSGTSNSGPTTIWDVGLVTVDGGFWALASTPDRSQAEKAVAELDESVDLQGDGPSAGELPERGRFEVQTAGVSARISWKVPFPHVTTWLTASAFGGAWGTTILPYYLSAEHSPAMLLVMGVGSVILFAIVAALVAASLAAIGRHHVIDISPDEVRSHRQGGLWRRGPQTLPLDQVHAVTINFGADSRGYLYLLGEDAHEAMAETFRGMGDGADDRWRLDTWGESAGLIRLHPGDLSFGELFELQRLIKDGVDGLRLS